MTINTTTTPDPDVPLPAGTRVLSDWDFWGDDEPRIVATPDKTVDATRTKFLVSAAVSQRPEGSIVDDPGTDEPPGLRRRARQGRKEYEWLSTSVTGARNLPRHSSKPWTRSTGGSDDDRIDQQCDF